MIYVLTDDDDEYPSVLYVIDGPDSYDIESSEQAFYNRRPRSNRDDFVRFLVRYRGFKRIDYGIVELKNRYVPPAKPPIGLYGEAVRDAINNYLENQVKAEEELFANWNSIRSHDFLRNKHPPTQKGDLKMAKKPAMPKSGKAKPKGGKCK